MIADDIKQICVVGAGTMGSQIALQCALNGFSVNLTDANEDMIKRGQDSNHTQLSNRVNKGKLGQQEAEAALGRVKSVSKLEEAAGEADFVIEAVYEDLEVKKDLFGRLDKICPSHTILASNSSTIVISKISEDIGRKAKAVNMHFFHPVLVMKLVEVVKGPDTSEETADITMELVRRIGREPVLMNKEVYGFIVNYVLMALTRAAMELYEGGYASYQDIDKAIKLGLNHPMGPFELADFSGVDIMHYSMLQRFKETGQASDKPPAFLEEMIKEGRLGRKSGKGFYEYQK